LYFLGGDIGNYLDSSDYSANCDDGGCCS